MASSAPGVRFCPLSGQSPHNNSFKPNTNRCALGVGLIQALCGVAAASVALPSSAALRQLQRSAPDRSPRARGVIAAIASPPRLVQLGAPDLSDFGWDRASRFVSKAPFATTGRRALAMASSRPSVRACPSSMAITA
jgi:hypothetical protein